MRPAIVAWLTAHGAGALAWLVPTPGLVYGLVFVALTVALVPRARTIGLSLERTIELALAGGLGAAIGTRLFFLIERGDLWRLPPRQLIDGSLGTASWGAYLGGGVGLLLYAWRARLPIPRVADVVASAAPLACVVGRWSCLLAGDDFGRVTTLGWGIRYPRGSYAWRAHVERGLLEPGAAWSLPAHPNQLVLSAAALIAFALTTAYWRARRQRPGETFAFFLVAYGGTRFPIEFLRDPAAGGATGLLSHSQYLCLAFVTVGGALLVWLSRERDALAARQMQPAA